MKDCVLKIKQLTKKYGRIKVLDDINITIRKGQIYGLIGLNGAGKSTLIRVITGLSIPNSGSLELFGEGEKNKILKSRSRIGSMVDGASLYQSKTVYENMYINRIQKGIPGDECIDKALAMVDLINEKYKKVKDLSLGTRQRLGIAMALIGNPEFLVLDEPINGLDPMKTIEIRELLIKLNVEYGITILISSHILGELYQVANHYGIIHKGKLVEEISVEELNKRCKKFLHLKVDDVEKAGVIINRELNSTNFNIMPNNIIKLYDYTDEAWIVNAVLVKAGIHVDQIMPMGDTLESYFAEVIGGYTNV